MNTQSPTTQAAADLNFYLRGALIGYPPDAVDRILDGATEYLDAIEEAARAEGRREAVPQWIIGRAARSIHLSGEGDECDGDLDDLWCGPCWAEAVDWLDPHTTSPALLEVDAAVAALNASESPPTRFAALMETDALANDRFGDASESVQPPESHGDEWAA